MRVFATVILLIVACVGLFFLALSRAPDMLSNNLSKKLGVAVSIDSIHFNTSEIKVKQLEIGNPKGYSLPKAFSAEEIEIEAPLTHYLREKIIIDEVEVENIYLGLEFNSTTSADGNWKTILTDFQEKAALDKESKQDITIKKLVFRNIATELLFQSSNAKVQKLPLIPEIVLYNVSTEGGLPTDQLLGSVLGQMIKAVFTKQNMQNLLQSLLNDPSGTVDNLIKPFEGLLNFQLDEQSEETKHLDCA